MLKWLWIPALAVMASAQTPLAARPYMGWSSWSLMRGSVTEAKVLAQADALKANGLDALGYRYVNVDDGWADGWDEQGLPQAKAASFPHGMDGLARALHERGLMFGIYLNPGVREALYTLNPVIPGTKIHVRDIVDTAHAGSTRNPHRANDPRSRAFRIDFSKPGAREFVAAEVQRMAAWGVDFIKLDFVGPGGGDVFSDNREEMREWHRAIQQSGRPMWLELSNYMDMNQATLWRATANGWRIENDIECYNCDREADPARHGHLTEWPKVAARFADVVPWVGFAGPGGWNDLDTLELGNGDKDGLTPAERQSMFAFWAIECAPLYLGSDLTKIDAGDLALISNRRLIAIDQAGVPARPVDLPSLRGHREWQVWETRDPDGSVVVALFNLGAETAEIKIALEDLDAVMDTDLAKRSDVNDVMTGEPFVADAVIDIPLASHASRILRWAAK